MQIILPFHQHDPLREPEYSIVECAAVGAEPVAEAEPTTDKVTEPEATESKPKKAKRSRKREPVTAK